MSHSKKLLTATLVGLGYFVIGLVIFVVIDKVVLLLFFDRIFSVCRDVPSSELSSLQVCGPTIFFYLYFIILIALVGYRAVLEYKNLE